MFFYLDREKGKNIVGPTEFLAEIQRIVYINDMTDTPFGPSIAIAPYDLFALNEQDSNRPIRVLIDSGGGYLQSFLFVYDVITEGIKASVYTLALGRCYSAAVLPFIAGKKGKRFCLPHTEFILHFPPKDRGTKTKMISLKEMIQQQSSSKTEKSEEDDGNVLYIPKKEWLLMQESRRIPVTKEDASKKTIKNILRMHLKPDKVEDVIKRIEGSRDGRLNIYSEEAVEVGIADKILTKDNRDEFF